MYINLNNNTYIFRIDTAEGGEGVQNPNHLLTKPLHAYVGPSYLFLIYDIDDNIIHYRKQIYLKERNTGTCERRYVFNYIYLKKSLGGLLGPVFRV